VNHQHFSLSRSALALEAVLCSHYAPVDSPNPQLELIVLLPQSRRRPGSGSEPPEVP